MSIATKTASAVGRRTGPGRLDEPYAGAGRVPLDQLLPLGLAAILATA